MLSESEFPPGWLEAMRLVAPCWVQPPSDAVPLDLGALASGCEWHDEIGHWLLLKNLLPDSSIVENGERTRIVLERMERALLERGMSFEHVVRTWFFLDEIHRWYDGFNSVRTRFFEERQLLGRMPASTAVGPHIEGGPSLLAGLLAVRPGSEFASVYPVPSPVQGSALDYGSAFSRAVEVNWSRGKRLYVSGTASIDQVGRTLHPEKSSAQAAETLRILSDLLASRDFSFNDVIQAICYLPEEDEGSWEKVGQCFLRGASRLKASICRENLKFEIELVAERKHG